MGHLVTYKEYSESRSAVSDSLQPHGLYSPWNSPGQNTGVGSLSLLQGIFPTQGSNPGLPHCGQILYQLSHKGSPRMLEWVAHPFYSRSSLIAQVVKNLPAMWETWVPSLLGISPVGGHGNPLQYSCLEYPHGQRSLADYSPWGCTESDTCT